MPVYTIDEAKDAAFQETQTATASAFEKKAGETILLESIRQTSADHFDIFLSHAYLDRSIVLGIYFLLKRAGYKIYVDWIADTQLNRSNITEETADTLRTRMRQCDSLMYLTTERHTYSKWMPWEAGYFDGFNSHVAILPVLSRQESFVGQEYLGLYPYAEKTYLGSGKNTLRIVNQNNNNKWAWYTAWIAGEKV